MELHKIRFLNYYHGHKVSKFFFLLMNQKFLSPMFYFNFFSFLDAPSVTL